MIRFKDYVNQLDPARFIKCYEKNYALSPYKVKLKLTERCNLRCVKCNYWRIKGRNEMGTDQVCKLLHEFALIDTKIVKFTGGEVCLRDDLVEIVDEAKRLGLAVTVTSNGTRIDKNLATSLVKMVDQIAISIDSSDSKIHDRMVGLVGSWEKSVRALRLLSLAKKTTGSSVSLVLQTVVSSLNYAEIPALVNLAMKVGADTYSLLPLIDFHIEDKSLKLSPAQFNHFVTSTLPEVKNRATRFGIRLCMMHPMVQEEYFEISPRSYLHIPCLMAWTSFLIQPNGHMSVCCVTKDLGINFGNVLMEGVPKVMNGESFKRFRQGCKPPIRHNCSELCISELQTNKKYFANLAGLIVHGIENARSK